MTPELDRLEHLFSRYLDGECTPEQRELLEALLRDHAQVRELFDDYRQLDQRVGDALRLALGRPRRVVPFQRMRLRLGRALIVAVAAGVAALVWLRPVLPDGADSNARVPQQAATFRPWFTADAPPQGDIVEPVPPTCERPELRVRGMQRSLVVIPGERPDTYIVIAVDRVRTHAIGVHQDF